MFIEMMMSASGGGIETLPWEELWSNPNPTQNFGAQPIYTSAQDIRASFKYLRCICKYATQAPYLNYEFEVIVNVINTYTNNFNFNIYGDVQYTRTLGWDYTTGRIDAGDCINAGGGLSNNVLIPYKIYGLRI